MWWFVLFLLCASVLDIVVKSVTTSAQPLTDNLKRSPGRRVIRASLSERPKAQLQHD
jgi:hypothetical protein